MIEWTKQGKPLPKRSPSKTSFGFVYVIRFTNGQVYLGKKNFWAVTKKPFGKKKMAEVVDKRAKQYEVVVKESKWREYEGSSKDVQTLTVLSKEILEVCTDSINLTYAEAKWMFHFGVLEDERFINKNVMGKFYHGKIKNQRTIK